MRYLLVPFLLCLCIIANAQERNEDTSGEIITVDNDTLLVDLKLNKINANSIEYRLKNSVGSFKEMQAKEILVVYSRRAAYFGVNVNGSKKLAKRMVNGPISAFEVQDDLTTLYILQNEAEEFIILNNDNFKTKIKEELDNCITPEELERLSFTKKYIEQVVYRYNACRYPERFEPVKIKSQPKIKLVLVAGLSGFSVKNSSDIIYNSAGDKLVINDGLNFTYDVGLDFTFELSKMVYDIGFHYTPYSFNATSQYGEGEITYSFLALPLAIRYKVQPNFSLGLGFSAYLGSASISDEINAINTDISSTTIGFGENPVAVNFEITAEYIIQPKLKLGLRLIRNNYSGTGSLELDGYSTNFSLKYVLSKSKY
ncbi:MAG: hypothetical protein ABJH05_02385 [Fulvivirga sp.]